MFLLRFTLSFEKPLLVTELKEKEKNEDVGMLISKSSKTKYVDYV